jgi:ubiquinone/menaquinone biosynthesis C-methylase UbiE
MTIHQSPQQTTGTSGVGNPLSQLSFPDLYEQVLVGPLFQPWVEPLLKDVEFRSGDRVLDIACGTGIVARLVKQRLGATGTVVGVDLNPQMLAVARQMAPMVDWREGDAAALPLRHGEQFDIVLCQQGYQFFPDQTAVAHQMHRALVKGGRLGVSTWCSDEEFSVLRRLRSIVEQHIGPISDRRHSLGDPSSLESHLREAGFRDVRSKRSARIIRFSDGFAFVRLNAMALIGMSAVSNSLSAEERQCLITDITRDSAQVVQLHTHESGFTYEIGTNVILARA